MNDRQKQLLYAIGRQGMSPEQLARMFGDSVDPTGLVADGYIRLGEIALFDPAAPDVRVVPPITYYALTEKGAHEIGLDPSLIAA